MFVRMAAFTQLQGFDEHFFAHMEEIDLCWRFNNHDMQVYYCGASAVYHVGGGTLPKSNPQKTYLNFRNGIAMLYKNSTTAGLLWKLPIRLLLDAVAAIKFLFFDSFQDFLAVLQADFDFIVNRGKIRSGRPIARAGAKRNPNSPILKGSIVHQYFLSGRRYFRELKF